MPPAYSNHLYSNHLTTTFMAQPVATGRRVLRHGGNTAGSHSACIAGQREDRLYNALESRASRL